MNHDLKAYLYDIAEASRHILCFTDGLSFEQYTSDELVKAAVERKFVITGEALSKLQKKKK